MTKVEEIIGMADRDFIPHNFSHFVTQANVVAKVCRERREGREEGGGERGKRRGRGEEGRRRRGRWEVERAFNLLLPPSSPPFPLLFPLSHPHFLTIFAGFYGTSAKNYRGEEKGGYPRRPRFRRAFFFYSPSSSLLPFSPPSTPFLLHFLSFPHYLQGSMEPALRIIEEKKKEGTLADPDFAVILRQLPFMKGGEEKAIALFDTMKSEGVKVPAGILSSIPLTLTLLPLTIALSKRAQT